MTNNPVQLVLLGDASTVISIVVGLIALAGWVVRQIMDANQQAAPPARGRAPAAPPPQPRAAPRGGVQMAGQQADPLRNQVEEFLRRAGRAPHGNQPAGPQRQPASEIELLLDDETSPAEVRPVAEPLQPAESRGQTSQPRPPEDAAKPIKQRPSRRPVAPKRRETLAERAAEREAARTKKIARRTSQLGQRIIEEDHQFDVQLAAKFDHTVGTIAGAATTTAAADQKSVADTPAGQIAAMLANPAGVRQAIILNEILRRPSDRW